MTGTEKGRPSTGALILSMAPFVALYVCNTIPEGFILGTVLFKILNLQHAASTFIGGLFASAIAIPWAFKPLWVWMVGADFLTHGRARKIFCVTTLGMGATVALVPFAAELGALPGLAVLLFCHNLLRSLQDVVTDGLGVREFHGKGQTAVQAVMRIAGTCGKLAGGALMLYLQGKGFSLLAVCLFTGVLIVASGLLGAFLLGKEKSVETQSAESVPTSMSFRVLLRALWDATPGKLITLALLSQIGGTFFVSTLTNGKMLMVLGYTPKTAAPLDTIFGGGALIGAFAGLLLGILMSQRKLLTVGVLLVAVSHIVTGMLIGEWGTSLHLKAIVAMLAFGAGVYWVGLSSLLASYTTKRYAATHFAAFMALLNLSGLVGKNLGGVTGLLAPTLPWQFVYPAMFILAGILSILTLLPLPWLPPPKKEE